MTQRNPAPQGRVGASFMSFPKAARRAIAPALAAMVAFAVTACVHESPYRGVGNAVYVQKQGPPPWAPAHGYRHKHADGVLLVYDAGLGSYRVDGRPGCYFHGGRYFCHRDGLWNAGPGISGPWTVVSVDRLPPGIAKKWGAGKQVKHRGHKHGHGNQHGRRPH